MLCDGLGDWLALSLARREETQVPEGEMRGMVPSSSRPHVELVELFGLDFSREAVKASAFRITAFRIGFGPSAPYTTLHQACSIRNSGRSNLVDHEWKKAESLV